MLQSETRLFQRKGFAGIIWLQGFPGRGAHEMDTEVGLLDGLRDHLGMGRFLIRGRNIANNCDALLCKRLAQLPTNGPQIIR